MKYKIKEPIIKYNENDSIVDKILKIRGIENKEEFMKEMENNYSNFMDQLKIDSDN